MKCRALHLLAEGWKLGIITDSLGHGQVEPGSVNRGQRHLLTQDVIADIQEVLLETPDLYPDEIAEWFLLTPYLFQHLPTTTIFMIWDYQES